MGMSKQKPTKRAVSEELVLTGHNGYGSTSTKCLRYSTIEKDDNLSWTYQDSTATSATITINVADFYTMTLLACLTGGGTIGISRNSTQLTTNIQSIVAAHRLIHCQVAADFRGPPCSIRRYLNVGDVIRIHGEGTGVGANADGNKFTITRG